MVFHFRLQTLSLRKPLSMTKEQNKAFRDLEQCIKNLKKSCPGGEVCIRRAPSVTAEAMNILDNLENFLDSNGEKFIAISHPIYNLLREIIFLSHTLYKKRRTQNPVATVYDQLTTYETKQP
jgi:hypothetical protein